MSYILKLKNIYAVGFLTISLLTSIAHAGYTVASTSSDKLDILKYTHVIISGKGNDLRLNPMIAALAKAKKIMAVYPNDQIFILNVQEVSNAEQLSTIRSFGFQILRSEAKLLDKNALLREIEIFKQISSLDFYGHSGIEPGFFLDGVGENDLKWQPFDKIATRLVGHFSKNAYAVLNGCNQGQILAPVLSKLWAIPVAGTLTSSHFEILYNDGKYYWNEESNHKRFALEAQKTLRMKPDGVLYEGIYGEYQSGLPFFKFFCSGLSQERCLRGMKASVFAIVGVGELSQSSSAEDYLKVVREWLCPISEFGTNHQPDCISHLEKITVSVPVSMKDKTYSPFDGPSTHCTFDGCYPSACFKSATAMSECAKAPAQRGVTTSTTFVDEYLSYVQAFNLSLL